MSQNLFENIRRINQLSGVLTETKENNFYVFKKDVKAFLLPFHLFVDSIEITPDASIDIRFHPTEKSRYIAPNQYYNLVAAYEIDSSEEVERLLELFEGKDKFTKLLLLKGGSNSEFFEQLPAFHYQSQPKLNKLSDIMADFQSKVQLVLYTHPNTVNVYNIEENLKKSFIETQKQLLKSVLYSTEDWGGETEFILHNPEKKGSHIIVDFKLSMDKNTYFLVGDIKLEYEGHKYNHHFDNLAQLKTIVNTAIEFLGVNFNPFGG
jgi:hypothetical protein